MGRETAAGAVIRELYAVRERIEATGLAARVVQVGAESPPVLVAVNPYVPALSVEIVCRDGDGGERWLCWARGGPICRAGETGEAVTAVRRVIGDLR